MDIDENILHIYIEGLILSKNLSKKEKSILEALEEKILNIFDRYNNYNYSPEK